MPINWKKIAPPAILLAIAALFVVHALTLSFTQDDAFISYRYVRNFLNGDGLVFNSGERVEGYTNFLLVMIMALAGRWGLDFILVSKIIGLVAGCGIIFLLYRWLFLITGRPYGRLFSLLAPLLLAANGAFAYWAISGLETLLFAALVWWGLYLAWRRQVLYVPILALATLTRPEGGLVFIAVLLYERLFARTPSRQLWQPLALYALLIMPLFIFRLYYYGDLLPNPFYAKTGWSADYIKAGWDYLLLFAGEYTLFGFILILPLLMLRKIERSLRLVYFAILIYLLYLLMVGGDVLHGHRFLVPLLAPLYLLFTVSLPAAAAILRRKKIGRLIAVAILLATVALTFSIPRANLLIYRKAERGLVDKMRNVTEYVEGRRRTPFVAACTTIGAFSYFSRATVIDMLGLTDRTVARDPRPIPGVASNWKERNYNIPYLLSRNPDYIIFSTGLKPSAPAEKALFMSSAFRKGYYPIFFEALSMSSIYKKKPSFFTKDEYYPKGRFIELFVDAIYQHHEKNFDLAYELARQCREVGPSDFYLPLVLMGDIQMRKQNYAEGVALMEQAVKISDGYALPAASRLADYYRVVGDSARSEYYRIIHDRYNRID